MGNDSFHGCQLWNFGYVLSVLNQFFMAEKHLAPGRSRQWVTGSIYGLICSPDKKVIILLVVTIAAWVFWVDPKSMIWVGPPRMDEQIY